ncbi:MAG: hypothetical protein AUK63_2400 [bacterium P3]|nr:MAG: hypothetical protein AUK63_2400 [bacterium P3]
MLKMLACPIVIAQQTKCLISPIMFCKEKTSQKDPMVKLIGDEIRENVKYNKQIEQCSRE